MSFMFNACQCGNKQTIHVHQISKFFVKCHHCGRQSKPHETQDGAVAIWNGDSYTSTEIDDAFNTVKSLRGTDAMLSDDYLKALDLLLAVFKK